MVNANPLVQVPSIQQLLSGQAGHAILKLSANKCSGIVYDSGCTSTVEHREIHLPAPEKVTWVRDVERLKIDGVEVKDTATAAPTLPSTVQTAARVKLCVVLFTLVILITFSELLHSGL